MEISDLLAERDRVRLTPAEQSDNEAALRRAILTLWQTSILRRSKLRVLDEVMNGLSYYEYTFLHELPRFYADLEDKLVSKILSGQGELPSFLTMGSWIGGDRDGNPFVDAKVLRQTLLLQNQTAMKFYLDQVQALGAALPLDARLVGVSKELEQLAAGFKDHSPHRRDEPYRRAMSAIHARLAATAHVLGQTEDKAAIGDAAMPYTGAGEAAADLDVVHFSLVANGSEPLARGRLRQLRRAIKVFGFHLASLDIRQNSDVHERAVSDLLEMAKPGTNYSHLPEQERIRILLAELATARPLASSFLQYSDETAAELAVVREVKEAQRRFGKSSVASYVISKTNAVSDVLEVAVLLKEAGFASATRERA